jgi:hypothetical protein
MLKVTFTAALLLMCIAPAASAGPVTVLPSGDFGVVDFGVAPPVAGAPSMTLDYHAFFGNRNGTRRPDDVTTKIRLPRGTRSNGPLLPQCPLPKTASDVGASRCAAGAKIGTGTFEADARPTVPDPVNGTLTVYNGEQVAGTPTVIFLAEAQVGGTTVRSELDFSFKNSGGPAELESLPPPDGTPTGLFSLTRVDAKIGKTIRTRVKGRRVSTGVLVPPRTCRKTWHFEEIAVMAGNGVITARDDVPCVA